MPYGAGLSFNQHFADEKDEILIAAAGPIFNFALAFFTISLWWIFPAIFDATEIFVYANIITGALNLFPAYPLDGGRILSSFLTSKNLSRKRALKVCFMFNYVLSGIFVVIFLCNIFQNITFLIFAICSSSLPVPRTSVLRAMRRSRPSDIALSGSIALAMPMKGTVNAPLSEPPRRRRRS